MEKCFDEKRIAKLTGTAVQDDETFKAEGGFVPERDQFYFEMKQGDYVFMVGFKELLICLRLLEKMDEIQRSVKNGGSRWQHFMGMIFTC